MSDEPAADSYLKSEELQPVFGYIKVWNMKDGDIWFTDTEDPDKTFHVDYITSDGKKTVKLERGHWYKVHGDGKVTARWVNVRVE